MAVFYGILIFTIKMFFCNKILFIEYIYNKKIKIKNIFLVIFGQFLKKKKCQKAIATNFTAIFTAFFKNDFFIFN
jgi:hypothetical protein